MKKSIRFLLPLVALAAVPPAPAAIVYSGVRNIPIPFTFDGIYLNIVSGATTHSQPADFNSAVWTNLDFSGVDIVNGDALRPVVFPGGQVINLPYALNIDGSSSFALGANASTTHIGAGAGQFTAGTPGFIGFVMNPGGGPDQYGWMQVVLNNTGSGGTIINYAYESTPGVAIAAGVPEPTTVASLALGLGCLLMRRRYQRVRD